MKTFALYSLILIFALLVACGSDDMEPAPDFSISSSERFEIISTYDNGWIKNANKLDFSGDILAKFEYHENGYLKYCATYIHSLTSYLYSEIERDEFNRPLSSTYYHPDGSMHLQNTYEEGELVHKKMIENGTSTNFQYLNGRVTKTTTTGISGKFTQISYDYELMKKTLLIKSNDITIHEEEFPLNNDLGHGINTINGDQLLNYIGNEQYRESNILTTTSGSKSWENKVDILRFVPAPVVYAHWNALTEREYTNTQFLANDDYFRSISEQYPLVEYRSLISGYRSVYKKFSVYPEISTSQGIWTELDQNESQFVNLYGDEFNNEQFNGKYLLTVATLRNLPSDEQLRAQIEDIAWKHTSFLISEVNEPLNNAEKNLLLNIFYELKVHSSSLDETGGIVINTPEDFESIIEKISSSENVLLQKGYKKYSSVALNPS
jgi:hypothetical protein